ncbi:MAG: hypothetical protein IJ313_14415 [Clostridia bacterium]|nr:hypothetical protein [Clostridia bacterium]
MSIPPFGLALRRRIPPIGFACLMAEYACPRQCVREAARGFSPARPSVMLRAKVRRAQAFALSLEREARFLRTESALRAEENAEKNRWQKCHAPQKRKFFCKKRKKARQLRNDIFCDCFCAAVGVIVLRLPAASACRRLIDHIDGFQADKGEPR